MPKIEVNLSRQTTERWYGLEFIQDSGYASGAFGSGTATLTE